MMRHFLQLALAAVRALAGSVTDGSTASALVATTGAANRLPAGGLGTAVEAVDVAPVAQNADPDLLLAALAVVQAVSRFHASPPPEDTGQRGRSGAS